MNENYAKDGVDIEAGDDFSAFAGALCKTTWENAKNIEVFDYSQGYFRGPRGFVLAPRLREFPMDVVGNGIGTKRIVTVEALTVDQSAHDLLAMATTDIIRWGGLPIVFCNVLDVSSLGKATSFVRKQYEAAMRELCKLAIANDLVVWRGETAELGICVGSENPAAKVRYNWAGFAMGVYPHVPIRGDTIQPGDIVYAFGEDSLRSNGYSAMRAAFRAKFGKHWWKHPDAKAAIKSAARPSVLYDRFFAEVNGWNLRKPQPRIPLKAIVHISGGGIPGKFGKDILFPLGLSAELDNLHEPPLIMQQCMEWGELPKEDGYSVLNGGQGILTVVGGEEEEYGDDLITLAKSFGIRGRRAGNITETKGTPTLTIHSKYPGGGKCVYTHE